MCTDSVCRSVMGNGSGLRSGHSSCFFFGSGSKVQTRLTRLGSPDPVRVYWPGSGLLKEKVKRFLKKYKFSRKMYKFSEKCTNFLEKFQINVQIFLKNSGVSWKSPNFLPKIRVMSGHVLRISGLKCVSVFSGRVSGLVVMGHFGSRVSGQTHWPDSHHWCRCRQRNTYRKLQITSIRSRKI